MVKICESVEISYIIIYEPVIHANKPFILLDDIEKLFYAPKPIILYIE